MAGGGAKCAYTLGCLSTLRAQGIEFDTVAGTSSGALLGALYATDSLDQLLKSDGRLPKGMFRLSWKGISLIWLLIAYNIAEAYEDFVHDRPVRVFGLNVVIYFYLLTVLSIQGFMVLVFFAKVNTISIELLNQQKIQLLLILFGSIFLIRFGKRIVDHTLTYILPAWLLAFKILYCIKAVVPWAVPALFKVVLASPGPLINGISAVWVYVILLPLILKITAGITEHLGISLFSPAMLKRLVNQVSQKTFSVKVYATVANLKKYHIPGEVDFINNLWGYIGIPKTEYCPEYLQLDKLSPGDREKALLASAALPYGVFPPVDISGNRYIDGGISDNLPLYPIGAECTSDEMVVIALKPLPSWVYERDDGMLVWAEAVWQKIDHAHRVLKASEEISRMISNQVPPRRLHFYSEVLAQGLSEKSPLPDGWPKRILVISPKEKLGKTSIDSINFRKFRTKALFDLGVQDTTEALKFWTAG